MLRFLKLWYDNISYECPYRLHITMELIIIVAVKDTHFDSFFHNLFKAFLT